MSWPTYQLMRLLSSSFAAQEGKKGGFLGGMAGFGKGLAGLALKPMTGVADMVSSTMQGIEAEVCVQTRLAGGGD